MQLFCEEHRLWMLKACGKDGNKPDGNMQVVASSWERTVGTSKEVETDPSRGKGGRCSNNMEANEIMLRAPRKHEF